MLAQLYERPDGRTFVRLRGLDPAAVPLALNEAVANRQTALFAHVDLGDQELVAACRSVGFTTQVAFQKYEVPFTAFLTPHRRPTTGPFRLRGADAVDPTALFRLDETLRQDVPGIDGWVGDRALFDDEMASTEFDAQGYLVAEAPDTGELAGLIRFWRNQPSPSLGLLGVTTAHRKGFLAHRLLHAGIAAASTWGSPTFTTHTARPALQRRLKSRGAACIGESAQMILGT